MLALLWLGLLLFTLLFLRHTIRCGGLHLKLPMADLSHDMTGKFCVVTGCTSGIGLETAYGLALMGARVCLASINEQEGEKSKLLLEERLQQNGKGRRAGQLIVAPVDLRSFEAIEAFARSLGNILQREQPSPGHIDVLVNCAGMAGPVESMFAVNFLGTAKLTCLLRPLMNEKGGRVIFTASDAHQIGEIRFDDFNLQQRWGCVRPSITSFIDVQRAYASTKLTLICWALEFVKREPASSSLRCFLVQPGCVDTPIGNENTSGLGLWFVKVLKRFLFKSPWQGAQTLIHCATSPACIESGRAWANNALWRFWNSQIDDQKVKDFVWTSANQVLTN